MLGRNALLRVGEYGENQALSISKKTANRLNQNLYADAKKTSKKRVRVQFQIKRKMTFQSVSPTSTETSKV